MSEDIYDFTNDFEIFTNFPLKFMYWICSIGKDHHYIIMVDYLLHK